MGPEEDTAAAENVLERLREIAPGRVAGGADAAEDHLTDRSGHAPTGTPLAVVHVLSTDEVSAVVKVVAGSSSALVVRGAGSGLAGGTTVTDSDVVLCLEDMDRILEVSGPDRTARVQAGIINSDLNSALAEDGLWWPPDPASKEISSVGGNIATNAGGLLCAKYGVTREAVLALTVVLADGSVIHTGHSTVKGVTGYDIAALMIGSEGTLGIITEATLRLRPARGHAEVTLAAVFDDVAAAVAAAQDVATSGVQPAIMELMDEPTVADVAAYLGEDPTAGGGALLLVQTDGTEAEQEARVVGRVLGTRARSVTVAGSEEEAEHLFSFRRSCFPAFDSMGATLTEDISVPRSRMAEAVAGIREVERRHGLTIPTTVHAGDGNLHPIFIYEPTPEGQVPEVVWSAAADLFRLGLSLGGTLTGEHGVGLLKKRFLADELGAVQMELQARVRAAFDPEGILNPGKVL